MWLFDVRTLQRHHFDSVTNCPPYAILSHCLEDESLSFKGTLDSTSPSAKTTLLMLKNACAKALSCGVEMLWSASLCIDRTSSAEVSEAINSMFHVYQESQLCIIYLSDLEAKAEVLANLEIHLAQCAWFRAVWMLQELIAPKNLQFYDSNWYRLGSKASLLPTLLRITHMDRAVMEDSQCLSDFSIGTRMSWAAHLSTTRSEDIAYSLLGIFKVNMTTIYGEGQRAFLRLQEKILEDTDDATLFAWQSNEEQQFRGLFAHSPSEFSHFTIAPPAVSLRIQGNIQRTSAGINIEDVFGAQDKQQILWAFSGEFGGEGVRPNCGILLREWNGQFVRCAPQILLPVDEMPQGPMRRICVHRSVDFRTSLTIANIHSPNPDPLDQVNKPLNFPLRDREVTASGFGAGKKLLLYREAVADKEGALSNTQPSRDVAKVHEHIMDLQPLAVKNNANATSPSTSAPLLWPTRESASREFTSTLNQLGERDQMSYPVKYSFVKDSSSGAIQIRMSTGKGTISLGRLVPTMPPRNENYGERNAESGSLHSIDIKGSGEVDSKYGARAMSSEFNSYGIPINLQAEEVTRLQSHHPYARFAGQLTTLGLRMFTEWVLQEQVKGKRAMQETMSTRTNKRLKSDNFESYVGVECHTDSEDEEILLVETLRAKALYFACPFYVRNPTAHQSCLAQTGLRNISGVRRHLWVAHRRPYYCPVCWEVFSSAEICDGHIRARTCELKSGPAYEGVTEYQMRQISDRIDLSWSAEDQWFSIWDILFRREARPFSSYLSGNIGSIICLVHDYWSMNGQGLVRDFLETAVKKDELELKDEGRDCATLQAMVIDRMVNLLLLGLRSRVGNEKGTGETVQDLDKVEEVLAVLHHPY